MMPDKKLLAAMLVVAAGCGLERGGPTAPTSSEIVLAAAGDLDNDSLPDALEDILVAQYRPRWFVDASETNRSIAVTDWANLGGFNAYGVDTIVYTDLGSLLAAVNAYPRGVLHLPAGSVAGRTADAPVYVEAVPMPVGYAIDGKANLVWLHYWLLFGDDVKPYAPLRSHRGDWEHVCVMVERGAAGQPDRPPVRIHWHHHGAADIAASAETWHADAQGSYHPRAYIEAGGHGIYRSPGTNPGQHNDGGGSTDDPLDDPLVFLRKHQGQTGAPATESSIVQRFKGRWGQTSTIVASPRGPLVKNNVCDHDYTKKPSASSFALGGCAGI